MMKKIGIVLIAALCFFFSGTVCASENIGEKENEAEEEILKQFEFGEIDEFLGETFEDGRIGFQELLEKVMSGDLQSAFEWGGKFISDQLFYVLKSSKTGMVHILLIVIIAAVFTNFSSVFQNEQISEISFYVLYLLLITISLNTFRILSDSAGTSLGHLVTFMKLLGPVYFLALAFAAGSSTSVMFYNLVLLLIYLVELLILKFLLPCVQIYLVVKMINYLSEEDYLSKFGELLETIIGWTLKTLLAGVVGVNLIQGLLSPAIDSLKKTMLTKGAEAIPFVGDALGGTAEVMLGTTVLIKNGIGVTGAVICILICLVPVIQMGIVTLMYKLVAAMIQPISDKRIIGSISSVAESSQMLLRIMFTSGVLFLLTIGIVTATTM